MEPRSHCAVRQLTCPTALTAIADAFPDSDASLDRMGGRLEAMREQFEQHPWGGADG
jgi:hypothetical protein